MSGQRLMHVESSTIVYLKTTAAWTTRTTRTTSDTLQGLLQPVQGLQGLLGHGQQGDYYRVCRILSLSR